MGMGGEEEVLEAADVAVVADVGVAVAEGIGGAGFELMGEGEREESEGLGFQIGHELERDAMVDDFEEPHLLARLHQLRLGLRFR